MGYYREPRWRGKQNQSHNDTIKRTHNRKKINTGTVNTSQFIRKASSDTPVLYRSDRMIADLPVDGAIIRNLQKKGYEKPTEIQDRTIEAILNGRNLMGPCPDRHRQDRCLPHTADTQFPSQGFREQRTCGFSHEGTGSPD